MVTVSRSYMTDSVSSVYLSAEEKSCRGACTGRIRSKVTFYGHGLRFYGQDSSGADALRRAMYGMV